MPTFRVSVAYERTIRDYYEVEVSARDESDAKMKVDQGIQNDASLGEGTYLGCSVSEEEGEGTFHIYQTDKIGE